MAKKLRAELDVDVGKAKRQLRSAGETVLSGSGAASAVPDQASKAAKRLDNLGAAADRTNARLAAAGKAFAGMAAGLAVSYAAKQMRPGGARDAVEYGGAAITGAAAGMAFGPLGAAIGGLTGLLKTYLDKSSAKADMLKDYEQGEAVYKASRAQMKKYRDLTDPSRNNGDVSRYLYGAAASGGDAAASASSRSPRSRLGTFSGFSVPARKFSEISFGGPSGASDVDADIRTATEASAALDKEIAETLKLIERNTKGGGAWQ